MVWILVALAAAAEPVTVPMMVPASPEGGVAGAPEVSAFGWVSTREAGFRIDQRLGHAILVVPFPDLVGDERCTCDARDLTCALLDDGSVAVRLEDPTRPRARQALGTCRLGEHRLSVVGAPPVLPPPFEAAPGRWAVPVRPGHVGPIDVVWLPRSAGWSAEDGRCALSPRGRGAVVRLVDGAPGSWTSCARHRSGQTLEARPLRYRMPWEPPLEAPVPVPPLPLAQEAPVTEPAPEAPEPRSAAPETPLAVPER